MIMEIIKMRKNCLGTMSFELKMGRMKKAEEFCTYPIQKDDNGERIYLQSGHRWAEMDTKTGVVSLSARRAQYANNIWLAICRARGIDEHDCATAEQLEQILSAIRGTAGDKVGNNGMHIFCDSSNAGRI